MVKVGQNQKLQFKVNSKLFYFSLIMLPLLVMISGCSNVVQSWRGNLINEKRINETVELSQPLLKKIDWDYIGVLHVHIEQKKVTKYDLVKRYEKILIRHYQSGNEGFINPQELNSVPYIAILEDLGKMDEIKKAEQEHIRLMNEARVSVFNGAKKASYPGYYGFGFGFDITYGGTYERDVAEEKEVLHKQKEEILINAAQVLVKATIDDELSVSASTQTDSSGLASFILAKTLKDSIALKVAEINITAKWNGKWLDLGSTQLTKERITQVTQGIKKENMTVTGTPKLPPFAKLSAKVPYQEIKADTDCELSLTVENAGKGEFYRLVSTSESLVPELDGLKFEFGKLDPCDVLTLTKKVHIPRVQPTGPVAINFQWSELNGYEPDPVQAKILIKGLSRPIFATSVQILDDNTGNSVGNGDGRIQKGEAVDLLVTTKNIGDGQARDVRVSLDEISIPGVVVNVSEQQLGEIAAGQSKQARLTVTTKRSADIEKLTPSIRVVDEYLGIEHTEQLALALETELAPSIMAYKTQVYVGAEEIPVRGGAGDETAIIARAKPGTVLQATGELGNWIRVDLPKIGTGWVQRSTISFEPITKVTTVTQPAGGVIEILQKQPPLIAVAKPLNNSKFNMARIEVSGVIADDQAVSLAEFKHNGQKIDLSNQRGIDRIDKAPTATQRELNFSFAVDLAESTNTIEITAWDNEGLVARKAISVIYEKERGNVYLVCIGIDKYKNVPSLKYAAADAQAVADCLQQKLKVPRQNVYVLLNENATLKGVKDTIGVKVRERAGKADTVIIYFAGHGAPEADPYSPDNDGVAKYLLPIEAERTSLYSTALPMEEVRTIFRRLVSERVIFLADTCYSGAAGGRTLRPVETGFRSINQDNLLKRLRDTGTGRVILTASQGAEVSQEKDELDHGVFTYYLLRGLDGKADKDANGEITITELYQYVSKEVATATKNTQHPMMVLDEMVGEIIIGVVK